MRKHYWIVACAIGLFSPLSSGQEANLSLAATQPPKGRITWREQARFTRWELPDRDIDEWTLNTRLTVGLSGSLSLFADIPVIFREDRLDGSGDQDGLGDIDVGIKWRFWQRDDGAIDTQRLAFIGSVRAPSGEGSLSSGGWDPSIGLVYTRVSGRHGVNASARYRVSTDGLASPVRPGSGEADLLTIETSYLYRLLPAEYAPDTEGSFYIAIESFVDYETNGDTEWRLAPGLLWEARRWAGEVSVILPVAESIDRRAETDFGLAFGVRVLF